MKHRTVLTACANADADAAVDALTRHLARSALSIISMRNPAFDPVTLREALRAVTGHTLTELISTD